ncbi:YciI family protein [Gryllotalpicola koreensis]|uniref:YciI family protein n=1 Tax=Gryllotalpicola koreensis TaxID=993086 RepID=A0ABP7ZVA5_9MICO
MTQYLLLHVTDPSAEPWDDLVDPGLLTDWLDERRDDRQPHRGSPIGTRGQAKSVAVRGGEVQVTDGPFPEFKEWFMGYDLIDADSMEDAVRIAATHPSAKIGRLYVLPNVAEWKDER